jgi:hypothetical protein
MKLQTGRTDTRYTVYVKPQCRVKLIYLYEINILLIIMLSRIQKAYVFLLPSVTVSHTSYSHSVDTLFKSWALLGVLMGFS